MMQIDTTAAELPELLCKLAAAAQELQWYLLRFKVSVTLLYSMMLVEVKQSNSGLERSSFISGLWFTGTVRTVT